MKSVKINLVVMVGLVMVLITGCGGGSSDNAASTPLSTVSGVVSDGPIENAKVFIDLNLNTLLDNGEPYDITDKDGLYKISYIFDSEATYLLVALGNENFDTADPKDNPNTELNFIMFDEIKSAKQTTVTNIVGGSYVKNIKPSIFKEYLSKIDKESYGAFASKNSIVKELIDAPANTSEQDLFKSILKGKSEFEEKLKEVAQKNIQISTTAIMLDAKQDLGVGAGSSLSISDDNSSKLANTLYYYSKTTPNKVGSFTFSKELKVFTTKTQHDVFVTKYDTILDIPHYEQLHDAKYIVIDGADIKAKLDGEPIENEATISLEIASNYAFVPTAKKVDFLQYKNEKWVLKAENTTLQEIKKLTIELLPFVIVEKASFTPKTYKVEYIDTFEDAMIVLKGKYTGLTMEANSFMQGESVALYYAKPDSNGDIKLNLADGFVVEELVVLSKGFIGVTAMKKASVVLVVEDDKVLQTDNSISPLTQIREDSLRTLVVDGDLRQLSLGLKSMIDTNIPYSRLVIGLDLISNSNAKDALLKNINSFMGGSNTFAMLQNNKISFDNSVLTSNETAQTITLLISNKADTLLVDEIKVVWEFSANKIKRVFSHKYSSGSKKASSATSTYIFEYKKEFKTIIATLNETLIDKNTLENYSDSLNASYIGSANFIRNADDSLKRLIGSKFTQKHESLSDKNGKNYLNGLVITSDLSNSLEDPFDNSLSFEGEFLLQSSSYEPIKGSVKIKAEDANTTKGAKNKNTVAKALMFVEDLTKKSANKTYIGNWNGSFTNSCSNKNGSIYVDFDTLSWQGFDGDSTYYGTSLAIENNISVIYNEKVKWGTLEMKESLLSGTWSKDKCDGNISLTKQ